MPYLMRGRNEAAVYFELRDLAAQGRRVHPRVERGQPDAAHRRVPPRAVGDARSLIERNPSVNRFVAGGRLYDREGIWFSYAVKQRLEGGSPIVVVKRRFDTDASFAGDGRGRGQPSRPTPRRPERSTVDKELGLLMKFPGFVRRIIMAAIRGLRPPGHAPAWFIDNDPMFASAFFAHMASFGMPPVYHHLYEYGTGGIFCVLGRPITEPGCPTSGPDRRRVMRGDAGRSTSAPRTGSPPGTRSSTSSGSWRTPRLGLSARGGRRLPEPAVSATGRLRVSRRRRLRRRLA